ncbi:MAG: hypothetical protein ABIO70_32275 [Pseudomonadota bacterium]
MGGCVAPGGVPAPGHPPPLIHHTKATVNLSELEGRLNAAAARIDADLKLVREALAEEGRELALDDLLTASRLLARLERAAIDEIMEDLGTAG